MRPSTTVALVIVMVLTLTGAIRDTCFAAAHSETPGYTGKKISLELQQADISEALRLIAAASGLNIITSPEVTGTITTRMMDMPWDRVLDAILRLHGLAQERSGNVVLIAPLGQVMAQHQARRRAQHMQVQASPTVTWVVPIKYRDAEELKAILERHLGGCAVISVDPRTNALIITGTPTCLRIHQIPTR